MNNLTDLICKNEKTVMEKTLLQCVAALTTHPWYTNLSPAEIFEVMQQFGCRTDW